MAVGESKLNVFPQSFVLDIGAAMQTATVVFNLIFEARPSWTERS